MTDPLDIEKTMRPGEASGRAGLASGATLGQYRIVRFLGRGGMGEVYEAENTVSRKRVALKVLPRGATETRAFVDRFRVEARVMSDLRHPHIVEVHHAGEEQGLYYLTMDLVTGPGGDPWTLEDLLAEGKPLPAAQARELALQICEAVGYAHGQGVVHRDLKPSNVLLRQMPAHGREPGLHACVSDFGLAKVVGPEYLQSVIQRSIQLSMAGGVSLGEEQTEGGAGKKPSSSARALLGTYDYMAPEQKSGGEVTTRSDMYAFGVVLYRMLVGRKPEGRWDLPSRHGCARGWDRIVSRCLRPDPNERYGSAGELAAAIRRAKRPAGWLVAAGVAAAVLAAGLAIVCWRQRPAPPPAPPPAPVVVTPPVVVPPPEVVTPPVEPPVVEPPPTPREAVAEVSAPTPPPPPEPPPGQRLSLVLGSVPMDFVWIPAGSFKMGSLSSEGGHFDNESPRRDVALSRGFWMQRTEFTQAQYERLMQANPSAFREAGDDLPVDSVSWNQAQSCCRALQALLPGELKGWQMRLPTEAEWEYACRAGAGSRFHTGDLEADLDRGGWYQGNSGGRTHPVGRKQANAWGLLDTHGNVAEWCADAYARDYYRNGPRADPPGPGDGAYQVVRGGAFDGSAATCRAARRVAAAPTFADRTIGFRVVLGRK